MKLYEALEKWESKALGTRELEDGDGRCCALGVWSKAEGIPTSVRTYSALRENWRSGEHGGRTIGGVWMVNDSGGPDHETPEQRYTRMLAWAKENNV